jgi:hypothetical protein
MKEFEYFIPQLNGWIPLSIEAYLSLLFSKEDTSFSKIKIPKGLPLCPKDPSPQKIPENTLLPGNFIEAKLNQNLFLETNPKNGRIQLITNSLKSESASNYEAWYRAKIISYDDNSKLLFVEINENIEIIDNLDLIRPLKEVKYTKNELLAYNIKSIQKSDYEKIKGEIDKINNDTEIEESNSTLNKIFEIQYNAKDLSLAFIGSKDLFRKISILKQYEQRNKKNISEEPNTNSDFSNPNSNKNLIGIKSPSGRSETSDYNNSNKNIILEKELKEEINNYKFKETFTYRDKFKKDIEKEAEELIQNCKYYIGKKYENNFDITIYGNDEQDFNEEKNIFEKQYKQVMLDLDDAVDKKEIEDLATKSKIKFFFIEKKCLYLVGEEKNINSFKAVWNLTNQYSKEIQKNYKENEELKKEIKSIKNKHKLKNK